MISILIRIVPDIILYSLPNIRKDLIEIMIIY